MSRLAKIDLVTCGGFKQRSLCSKKTVSVSGVHWNFFSSREEWYERPEQGTIAVFVFICWSCPVLELLLLILLHLVCIWWTTLSYTYFCMYLCMYVDIFEKSAKNKMFSRTCLIATLISWNFTWGLVYWKESRSD